MSNAKATAYSKPKRRLPADEREFRQWFSLFGGELLVNLAIYADDSGTHCRAGLQPQSEVATVAGYAGKVDSWVKFRRDWKAVLEKHRVDYFHYSPLMFAIKITDGGGSVYQKDNPYCGKSKQQCEGFLSDCAKVAAAGNRQPLAADFDTRKYSQSTIPEKLRMSNPHAGAVWMFYENALEQLKAKWPAARGPIVFCFDQSDDPEWRTALCLVHQAYQRSYGKALPQIGNLMLGNKQKPENYGLQAADLLAGRSRQLARLILKYDLAQDEPLCELDKILFGKFGVKTMKDVLSRRSSG